MMAKPVTILAFPSNLGLIEPGPGQQPGVRKLPAWLKQYGLYDLINPAEDISLMPPVYTMDLDSVSQVRNADAIVTYAFQQSAAIRQVLLKKHFALVLGGDCSILIGNALALKKLGNYKLFFIDGHTDFMGPALSNTHGAAGMDLAIVTGYAHDTLSNIEDQAPYFREQDVWCVGNREYDPLYVAEIEKTAIHYYDLKNLRSGGIQPCVQLFFDALASDRPDGFWIHLDVDVLDPKVMPAVDSPDPGGLQYAELLKMLEPLLNHSLCAGMEITILDPDLDRDGQIVKTFIEQVGGVLAKVLT